MSYRHDEGDRRPRFNVIVPTIVGGGAIAFLSGFLVGLLTEPVAGTPGGVPGSWWLTLPFCVVVILTTFLRRAIRRRREADGRLLAFGLNNRAATLRRLSALVASTSLSRE